MTTDLLTGGEILWSKGLAEPVLLASAAIPLVFPAVQHEGHVLVDGGIASNAPICSAIKLGAEHIIVLPTGFGCACKAAPTGLASLALHSLNLLSMRQLVRDAEHYSTHIPIAIVPTLCPLGVSVFDFTQTASLIQRSEALTTQWLAADGLNSSGVPMSLQAHHHA